MDKKKILIVIFLIIINENLFYLVERPLAPIVVGVGILTFIFKTEDILQKKYLFKKEILILLLVCFISEISAWYNYNQPIVYGIFGMHYMFIYLLYFYFVDLFNNPRDKDIRGKIYKVIVYTGTIMSVIYLIQAIIYPKIIIFNMSYAERSGRVRFFTGYIFVMFSIIFTYAKILKKIHIKYLVFLILQLISLVIVSQTRNFIIAIFLVIICGIFISKKSNKILVVYLMVLICGVYSIWFVDNDNFFNNLIKSVLTEYKSQEGTIGTRMLEINYYMNLLKENLFFGIGILYSRFELTPYITGFIPYYYFLGDIGMVGFIVQTGILGALWLIIFLISLYTKSKKNLIYDEESYNLLRLTLIFILGMFASGIIADKGSILYIVIILAITEYRVEKRIN